MEHRDRHDVGGSCHGGEFRLPSGEELAGWPSHRLPVDGLCLTGGTAHPGGSVSGRAGRTSGHGEGPQLTAALVSLPGMPTQLTPFLMFQGGVAEQAMTFYTSLFDDGAVVEITRYGAQGPAPEGTVQRARFTLAGQEFFCSDSFVTHDFSFTPSLSIWIETESREELERLFAALGDGGAALMPLDDYGFSRRFGWVNDRFGVSWQLNLG